MIDFVYACLHARQHGLIEKSRDMGATWLCCAISVHLFLFWSGASIGWGSKDAKVVDALGDPDSILEKIRILMRNLPREFHPPGFSLKDHMSQFFNEEEHEGAPSAEHEMASGRQKDVY